MEMGKHIIVFITAILMPFMAYGNNCSDITDIGVCNETPGCGASSNGMNNTCKPCGAGYFNADDTDNNGCIACTNAPKGCGTDDNPSCDWMQGEAHIGLTSNTCPWQLTCPENQEYDKTAKKCADCTPGFYNNNPTYIYNGEEVSGPECSAKTFKIALKYMIDGATYTPEDAHLETVTVSKTEPKLSISAQSYEQTLRNQYNYNDAILSYNNMSCTMKYDNGKFVSENDNCDTLLKNAHKENAELTLTLTVTAKNFQYVLVPMNSVENDKYITIGTDKNTSDVESGTFGKTVEVSSDTEYYQYNNCTYDKENSTVNCQFKIAPTTHSDKINYEFKYSDDTIIVLERATCTPGEYCPTYKADDDEHCPNIFWSDKNSATSITDCYLDSSVTFIDDNGRKNLITDENTKVYYRGNSTQ